MDNLGFIFIVEQGDLERKAVLLVESIRKFGGEYKNSTIFAIQPRTGGRISQETLDVFANVDVHYIFSDLNREWANYGFGNKIYACALVETLCLNYIKNLCFLDTDILCSAPPQALILGDSHDIALCPVDKKGVGLNSGEVLNTYWQAIFELYDIEKPPKWTVNTTYENEPILPYFNAGMITVNPAKRLFKSWETGLNQIKTSEFLKILSQEQHHHLDQALLAALVLKQVPQERIKVLPPLYNYPLHQHTELPQNNKLESLSEGIFFTTMQCFTTRNACTTCRSPKS